MCYCEAHFPTGKQLREESEALSAKLSIPGRGEQEPRGGVSPCPEIIIHPEGCSVSWGWRGLYSPWSQPPPISDGEFEAQSSVLLAVVQTQWSAAPTRHGAGRPMEMASASQSRRKAEARNQLSQSASYDLSREEKSLSLVSCLNFSNPVKSN